MMAILGFGKEFGFNSKCDGKLLDGFKEENYLIYIFSIHLASAWRTNFKKTQMIIGRCIRRLIMIVQLEKMVVLF